MRIIGNNCFKFIINIFKEKNDLDGIIEVDWTLKIFCTNCDYLIPYTKDNNYKQIEGHYFSNCDCYKRMSKLDNDKTICYYNKMKKEINKIESL